MLSAYSGRGEGEWLKTWHACPYIAWHELLCVQFLVDHRVCGVCPAPKTCKVGWGGQKDRGDGKKDKESASCISTPVQKRATPPRAARGLEHLAACFSLFSLFSFVLRTRHPGPPNLTVCLSYHIFFRLLAPLCLPGLIGCIESQHIQLLRKRPERAI